MATVLRSPRVRREITKLYAHVVMDMKEMASIALVYIIPSSSFYLLCNFFCKEINPCDHGILCDPISECVFESSLPSKYRCFPDCPPGYNGWSYTQCQGIPSPLSLPLYLISPFPSSFPSTSPDVKLVDLVTDGCLLDPCGPYGTCISQLSYAHTCNCTFGANTTGGCNSPTPSSGPTNKPGQNGIPPPPPSLVPFYSSLFFCSVCE